ncbi:MAG TPA: hypothetical protein VJ808_10055, partial [Gemmatimonadales bacterium]|nr:hypothetical protein [Gemmatimonadales bacterium]
MARNVFGLALLAALALSGCSKLDNLPLVGNRKAKEAEAKAAALRTRTDSLRKARRSADSLAQVRFAVCVDSVRAELIKPVVVVKKSKGKRRKVAPPPMPSEELISVQAQSACGPDATAPVTTLAAVDSMTSKTVAAVNAVSPTPAVD